MRLTTMKLMALAGLTPLTLPGLVPTAYAQSVFKLKGTLRDFKRTDTQFNVLPVGGNGHYAGNLSLTLPSDEKPVFVGGGFKVASQWKDEAGHPMAPHLYVEPGGGPGVIRLSDACTSPKHGVVDTYNSKLGPYGGSNVGPAPQYIVPCAMPAASVPPALEAMPNVGDVTYKGTTTIASNVHCNNLDGSGTIRITGNVAILCEGMMALATHTTVSLNPGATLTLYLKGGASSWNHTVIGDPLNPARVQVFNLSEADLMIHNHASVYASIVSPNATMELSNHGTLYGHYTGKAIKYDNHGDFHVDASAPMDDCGVELKDVKGTKGLTSNGGIHSAAAFGKWYTDTLGSNLSMPFTMNLTKNAGVWQHLNDSFHPLDKKLFGNEGQPHNNYFTFTAAVSFIHHGCADTFFEFTGCDDVWLFIDNEMVLDRGGTMPNNMQYVDVDRLGLEDGQVYRLHFFHAQRNPLMSSFRLRTNLDLIPEPDGPMMMSAATD